MASAPTDTVVPLEPESDSTGAGQLPGLTRKRHEKSPLLPGAHRRLFRSLLGRNPTSPVSECSTGDNGSFSGGTSLLGSTEGNGFSETNNANDASRLGTFAGVFVPVALSQFSALLFLRVGYVVGNAGLLEALLQFVLAYGILLFTVLSICAISTNGAVEGGGAYFMISRTLGPEFGGSVGTMFFVANVFSSTLYATGTVEGLVSNFGEGVMISRVMGPEFGGSIGLLFFIANVFSSGLYIVGCREGLISNFGTGGYIIDGGIPSGRWMEFLYGTCVNVFNLVVCLIGASMFARTAIVIFGVLLICLGSVTLPEANTWAIEKNITVANYSGFSWDTFYGNLFPQYSLDYTIASWPQIDFSGVFGVLFSGVTGIMAGANMSGDLKDPGRSIPRGTIGAVGFTLLIYILLSFGTAATCPTFLLQNNYIYMMNVNLWAGFITVGVIVATLSASLSNLIGASRVLEALAKDKLFGPVLSPVVKGTTSGGNPIAAVIMSWFFVQIILLIGSLNLIAQITSVFFLLSYCATNLACLSLELASAPNFRPNFQFFSWHTAFLGLIGTVVMMFVISPLYAAVSICLCLLLIIALHLRSPPFNWGSISQALIFHQVRKYLLLLDPRKAHVKFWRPQMLLMVSNPRAACPLILFANDLKKSGLYVVGHVKVGDLDVEDSDPTSEEYSAWLSLVDHLKVKAFIELTLAPSVRVGMHHLVRISGLGAMKPNTILLGFFDDEMPQDFFAREGTIFHTAKFEASVERVERKFPLRSDPNAKQLPVEEYVATMRDIIVKFQKNLCVCRHFAKLDRETIRKSRTTWHIDVWPLNFLQPSVKDLNSTTSLFTLQLATILNMTAAWKKFTDVRVFLCVASLKSEDVDPIKSYLSMMLHVLRIKATIVCVPCEEFPGFFDHVEGENEDRQAFLDDAYFNSVRALISARSRNTAVTFLYLPEPPAERELAKSYVENISKLTDGLAPTVLVHGVSPVTTTTL
ncbi:unnamed protein product [Notodromas monacha]|uniref:Solute carrier family 12 member 9 n=1 Tax=Notodromas monacha TaxID=399045 RepID=A0A7R9GBJ7_9CRUS|nr:unnamed protein product [Notodromas monacha]CAG0916592.1 unnamed protein product [Notodromas monacha]